MENVCIILCIVLVNVCGASTEKRLHEVSHADTEIKGHIVMRDVFDKWDDDVNDKNSEEYKQREFLFCKWNFGVTTGATSGANDVYSSGSPDLTPFFINSLFLTAVSLNTNTASSLESHPKYESCGVDNIKLIEKIDGDHIVTVDFKLTFVGRDYRNVASYVYETINKEDLVHIGDSILDQTEYGTILVTIVYNTHEVSSLSGLRSRTITAFNKKMENVESRRYILKVIPANQMYDEDEKERKSNIFQSREHLSARHLSTLQKLFGNGNTRAREGVKSSRKMDEEELLKQLVALRQKLNEEE